eukprot:366340-Chlamydomonas_euryale.AAC.5
MQTAKEARESALGNGVASEAVQLEGCTAVLLRQNICHDAGSCQCPPQRAPVPGVDMNRIAWTSGVKSSDHTFR